MMSNASEDRNGETCPKALAMSAIGLFRGYCATLGWLRQGAFVQEASGGGVKSSRRHRQPGLLHPPPTPTAVGAPDLTVVTLLAIGVLLVGIGGAFYVLYRLARRHQSHDVAGLAAICPAVRLFRGLPGDVPLAHEPPARALAFSLLDTRNSAQAEQHSEHGPTRTDTDVARSRIDKCHPSRLTSRGGDSAAC